MEVHADERNLNFTSKSFLQKWILKILLSNGTQRELWTKAMNIVASDVNAFLISFTSETQGFPASCENCEERRSIKRVDISRFRRLATLVIDANNAHFEQKFMQSRNLLMQPFQFKLLFASAQRISFSLCLHHLTRTTLRRISKKVASF